MERLIHWFRHPKTFIGSVLRITGFFLFILSLFYLPAIVGQVVVVSSIILLLSYIWFVTNK